MTDICIQPLIEDTAAQQIKTELVENGTKTTITATATNGNGTHDTQIKVETLYEDEPDEADNYR